MAPCLRFEAVALTLFTVGAVSVFATPELFSQKKLSPVILVPGDGGSQFEATLDKPSVVHRFCQRKTTEWFELWLNLELLAPFVLDCFIDNMRLQFDNVSRTTSNQPGVKIRQPLFGNTSSVEWLDSSRLGYTSYFYHIVEYLQTNLSYVRNVSIRGAPYDFRKAPNEMEPFMVDLEKLIIESYEQNSRRRVVLIAHSMGNLYIQLLLSRKPQQWKDKYVRAFISLGGPWGGAAKPVRLMVSGDNLGVYVVSTVKARVEQRSMPSTAWLMPFDTFWDSSEILVYSPKRNYTVADYKQLFDDVGYPDGYLMRLETENFTKKLDAPGVEVHCLHGVGVKTPAAFVYSKSKWYDGQPDVITGDGDGTVNARSLAGCLRWSDKQSAPVYYKQFQGAAAEHLQMLKNRDIMEYIGNLLRSG